VVELTSTALITEHQPGRYSWHDLIRAYATELSERSDTDADRHEAQARLLHHWLASSSCTRYPAHQHGQVPCGRRDIRTIPASDPSSRRR